MHDDFFPQLLLLAWDKQYERSEMCLTICGVKQELHFNEIQHKNVNFKWEVAIWIHLVIG